MEQCLGRGDEERESVGRKGALDSCFPDGCQEAHICL